MVKTENDSYMKLSSQLPVGLTVARMTVNVSYIQSTLQNVFIVITDILLLSYRTCRISRIYGSATTERDNVPHVPHLSKELLHQTVSPAIVQRPGFGGMTDICCMKHQR